METQQFLHPSIILVLAFCFDLPWAVWTCSKRSKAYHCLQVRNSSPRGETASSVCWARWTVSLWNLANASSVQEEHLFWHCWAVKMGFAVVWRCPQLSPSCQSWFLCFASCCKTDMDVWAVMRVISQKWRGCHTPFLSRGQCAGAFLMADRAAIGITPIPGSPELPCCNVF